MKLRNMAFTIATVTAPLLFFVSVQAQPGAMKPIRVQFAKGSNSVVLSGSTSRPDQYVLSARIGQSVEIKVDKVSGRYTPTILMGTVPRGTNANIWNEYKPEAWGPTTDLTYVLETDRDIAVSVAGKPGTLYKLSITIPASPSAAKTDDLILGDGVLKYIRLDPITKSATVSGITADWRKKTTVYHGISLRRGQKLLISANSDDISIETYTGFEPLEGLKGRFLLEAHLTTGYQIVARSKTPGKKYTLTLKLQ